MILFSEKKFKNNLDDEELNLLQEIQVEYENHPIIIELKKCYSDYFLQRIKLSLSYSFEFVAKQKGNLKMWEIKNCIEKSNYKMRKVLMM